MQYPDDFVNKVILGDNIVVMKDIPDEVVDLIYLDPPYGDNNTDKQFGLKWDSLQHYLDWMRPRIEDCYRVLKPTGSFFLHCDWRASHYLKVMLDEIYGYDNFKNNIVWCYTHLKTNNKNYQRRHYDILFYTKTDNYTFIAPRIPYVHFRLKNNCKGDCGESRGKLLEDWWIDIQSCAQGYMTKKEDKGFEYPTKKPVELLKRIINASSNKKDIILDPFCGSGTTLKVAWKLDRYFIGIDNLEKAFKFSNDRLKKDLGQLRFDSF